MKIRSSIVTSADVLRFIEEARDAELCRNLALFRELLSVFWEDIDGVPDVSSFHQGIRPEMLRLCGVFLSQYGRARGLPDYQERAKNILTRAADMFESLQSIDKAAETKVGLATCYWYSGEVEEHDAMLRTVEEEFSAVPGHRVAIQIKLNRVLVAIWRCDRNEANSLVGQIGAVIGSQHDLRLRTQFHNLAGIVNRMSGKFDQSAVHAKEAVRIAREAGHHLFLALSLNNLAFVYRVAGRSDQALATSDESIAITEALGDKGWTAHFLDTKALIYIDQAEYDKALTAIDRAIEIFSEGEDYSGRTDAMWTKCLCLLRLDRVREACELFSGLTAMAARQIGGAAVDKFARLFAGEVYALKHFPLTEEVAAFKRARVLKAMRVTGGHVSNAARVLGLRSQQHLSEILGKQFPDIFDELGIKRRVRRSGKGLNRSGPEPRITRLIMPEDRSFSFAFPFKGQGGPQFFYFPRNIVEEFGVKTDAVVAVMPANGDSLYDGASILYFKDEAFRLGRLSFDEFTGLFLVDLEEFTFLSDVQMLGVPIGYCPASERKKRVLTFEPLRPVKRR